MKRMKKDPMAERERSKYEHPVSSRELIMEHLEKRAEPLVFEQIAHDLEHQGEAELEGLRRRMGAMIRDGQVVKNRRGGFGLATSMDLVQGRVQGHKDGFGFLVPEKGGDDMFLSAREMRKVMHGDRVMARVSGVDRRGRSEGAIVEVLEHCTTTVAGRYFFQDGVSGIVPTQTKLSQEILVSEDGRGGAEDGQMVVLRITHYPEGHRQAIGIIERVLGDHMAPGMEIDVALHSFDLPHEWPEAVDQEADLVPARVPPKAKAGREDLRELPLVTIDGEDARDFDDAVYCEPDGKGWRLLVAIADVSHYVTPDSALDQEAENRGTSVYFPEQVIPMLPEVLSNGLCSINPKVDRLCMVCEMHLGPRGKVNKWRFFEGVMRSKARLTYNKVAAILDGDKRLRATYKSVVPHLENLHALYKSLAKLRRQRGAIDFDSTETRIIFGPERKIESIVPVERNDAHRLIEECMIAANVAAGEFLTKHKIPGLYRVHAGPSGDKLIGLRDFLKEMGLDLAGGDEPGPRDYARLLDSAKGRPDAQLIQTVMLRSLKQAVYTPENNGHFGLAVKAYSHFTSPIRRYPDLLLHRAIKHILHGGKAKDFRYGMPQMEHFGEHCSMTSRRADEAGWDVDAWLKAEYMLDKDGQHYTGIVTSVTGFGLFVQLQDVFVEGLVHVSSLNNDYYHFDPMHHRLSGERTGQTYRLGDSIEVVVGRVDLQERRIDFMLPHGSGDEDVKEKRPRKPKHKRSRAKADSGADAGGSASKDGKAAVAATKTGVAAESKSIDADTAAQAAVQSEPRQPKTSQPEPKPVASQPPEPVASEPAPSALAQPEQAKQQSQQQASQGDVDAKPALVSGAIPQTADKPKRKRRPPPGKSSSSGESAAPRGKARSARRAAALHGGDAERPALFDTRPSTPPQQQPEAQSERLPEPEPEPEPEAPPVAQSEHQQPTHDESPQQVSEPRPATPRKKKRSQAKKHDDALEPGNVWTNDDPEDSLPDEHLDKVFNGNVASNTPEVQLSAVDRANRSQGRAKPKAQGGKRRGSEPSGNKSPGNKQQAATGAAKSKGQGKPRTRRRKPKKSPGRSDNSGNV